MSEQGAHDLLQRALEFPADERLALARDLLDSVEGRQDPRWAAAWAAELDRRVRELESGDGRAIPWEHVKAEVEARLRSR